ncbi:astakine [Andrena cerasifolii]|uniref:astakine n=1 Tax=Andrena cerasifolii TaxID=2819439 RepID=UPI0040383C49
MTSLSICLTSFLLFALSGVSRMESIRPDYIHCQTNLECEPGYCCTIGPMRYSIPQCKPMQEEGNICRPGSVSTLNMTATYPDGAEVLLTDVHYILCPCVDGLACDTKEGVCKNAGEKRDANRLLGENSKPDD